MSDAKPGIWAACELRELLSSDFPGAWGRDPGPKQANVSVLRSTNLDNEGHIDYSTGAKRYLVPRDLEKKRLLDGDILLEASGGGPGKPVGRVALFKPSDSDNYVSSNFFRTLRPQSIVDSSFLAWYLQWTYLQPSIWQFQQQTTGIINLKHKDYLRQSIFILEFQEQRRIVDVLDTADEAIRSTERLIVKLEQERAGLLHYLFPNAKGRVTRIPKNWNQATLGDNITLISGQHIPAGLCNSNGDGVAYFTGPSDFTGDVAVVSQFTAYPQVMCRQGDILVTVKGSGCGRVAFAPEAACISRQLMAIRPQGPRSDFDFWFEFLRSRYAQLNVAAGSGLIPGLSRADLAGLPVLLPPLHERRRISIVLNSISDRIVKEWKLSEKLRLLKHGLMDDLLTGRVRVGASG